MRPGFGASLRLPWRRRAILGFLLFAAAGGARGQAQRAILALRVNEVDKGEVVVLVRDADVLMRVEDLESAGIEGFGGAREILQGQNSVSLASLAPGIAFRLDPETLVLEVTADPRFLPVTRLRLRTDRPPGIRYGQDRSGFLNYSVTSTDLERASAFAEAGVSFQGKLLASTFTYDSDGRFLRGLSNLTVDDREKLVRWVFGDSFASAGQLGGGVFLAGVTVSREFDLDPYFVRFPGFGLSGAALTPSTAEVYVNGTLVRQLRLPPGRFELGDVPVTAGSGTTRVILKDVFGRAQEISAPYYYSIGTLARGLSEYNYSLGFEREELASDSFDYGRLAFLGNHRVGLTDTLTLGGRLEADSDLASGGPTLSVSLPLGELDLALGASHDSGDTGFAASLGYSYLGRVASLGVRVQGVSSRYAHLALPASDDRATFEASAFGGIQVSSSVNLTAQYTTADFRDRGRSQRISAASTYRVTRRGSVVVSGSRSRTADGRTEYGAFAGLSYSLGPLTTASVSYQRAEGENLGVVELQRSLPVGPGLGYRVQARADERSEGAAALVQYQNAFGRYELAHDRADGEDATTLTAAGGIVAMGGGLFFTRPLHESFALIQVPDTAGVGGLLNNQRAGETDSRGNLLVPDLLPYYGNRLGITDQDVPMDRIVEATEETVAPPLRGGVLVRFPVRRVQIFRGLVSVASQGKTRWPSFGELTVEAEGKTLKSPIGKGGEFYLENVPPGSHPARVEDSEGSCEFTLTVRPSPESILDLGTVPCVAAGSSELEH